MMTKAPRVSVIIPTYNRSALLACAINSVRPQLLPDDEILVIDDGSTDDTQQVVATLSGNIRYFQLQNGGPSNARNFGLAQAQGELCAFLDDDDEWLPNKLHYQRTVMQARSDVTLCFTNFSSRYKNGTEAHNCLLNWGQREQRWNHIFDECLPFVSFLPRANEQANFEVFIGNIYLRQMFDDYVLPSTQIIRKCAATADVTFPGDLRFCESWAFSSKMAKTGKAAYLNIDTAIQHDHGGPRLTSVDMIEQITSRITVLEREWGSNTDVLQEHGSAFRERLDQERLLLIRELIARNETSWARRELNKLYGSKPMLYKALSSLPDVGLAALNNIRQKLKR